jgi:hypothetical protein
MTTLTAAPWGSLAVPRRLPVRATDGRPLRSLSKSSIELWERCREAWKRRYIDGVREPAALFMAAGSALSAALAAHFQAQIATRPLSAADVDDRLLAELGIEFERAEPREDEDEAKTREGTRAALSAYLAEIAPSVRPKATERVVELRFPGAEWTVVGYLDLETEDGGIVDYKLAKPGGSHVNPLRAENDVQKRLYMLCRWLEGDPAAGFSWHSGLSHEPRSTERWRVIPASATRLELEQFQARVALVARQIAAAAESGDWGYSTGGWWCGPKTCPHWTSCPGGALR